MKKGFIIIAIIIIIINLIMWLPIIVLKEGYTTSEQIKKEFTDNYLNIKKITDFLADSNYSTIYINRTDYIYEDGFYGSWYAYNEGDNSGGKMRINDDKVVEMLNDFFKNKGYQTIVKDQNAIHFQLWANLDAGSGVVYSMDGNEPKMQLLVKLEKLDKDNWYYYERCK